MTSARDRGRRITAPLWRLIVERYGRRRFGLAPRPPLVHFRHATAHHHPRAQQPILQSTLYHIALSVNLAADAPRARHERPPVRTIERWLPGRAWPAYQDRSTSRAQSVGVIVHAAMFTGNRRPHDETLRLPPPGDTQLTAQSQRDRTGASPSRANHPTQPGERLVERRHGEILTRRSMSLEYGRPLPPHNTFKGAAAHSAALRAGTLRRHLPALTRRRSMSLESERSPRPRNTFERAPGRAAVAVRGRTLRPGAPREQRRAASRGMQGADARQHLFPVPVTRSFARSATVPVPEAVRAASPSRSSAVPAVQHTAPPQPPIDIARLSEDVYRHIERKVRIDRERRGL